MTDTHAQDLDNGPDTDTIPVVGGSPEDVRELVAHLDPKLRPGQFVVTTVGQGAGAVIQAADATVVEDEGVSLVLQKDYADQAGLAYDYVAAWITLRVNSSLTAVGLTAAVSTALTERGLSANVIAGHHHDHLLVGWDERESAMAVLQELSAESRD